MIVTFRREKLINAVLYFARNTKFCGKTKLMKLLYFLDFTHFQQTGKAVTELDYYAWDFGPVPRDFFYELSGNMGDDLRKAVAVTKQSEKFEQVCAKIKPNLQYFSPREQRILENICVIFRDVKAEEISEISHLRNHPWDRTIKEKGESEKIDYLLAVDDGAESLSLELIQQRVKERQEMYKTYGVI
ncbi:MAG: SocA family protein [Desulfobulbaceae bacterium]|nr:MAG: SocA family protein [Desulfobulbaceae bacterium]